MWRLRVLEKVINILAKNICLTINTIFLVLFKSNLFI
uniref:Uncharacterized protein n=1 Tax=Laurenciella marilzae TaxID=1413812 RepID=A0A1Z1M0Z5_9FLOR|nr:hypothetical protein [Laurenciella marilzae]ARW59777.1 hypothetical protein [Laurenciella marilzae]